MDKRIHFYVSRKSVLTWLMALCMVCSAVARIVISGMKGTGSSLQVWSQIILPVAASLLYVLIALINGKERFYKTAIPIWMYCLYFYFVFRDYGFDRLGNTLYIISLLFVAVLYTQFTSGKKKVTLLLFPLLAIPSGALLYLNREALLSRNYTQLMPLVPDLMMLAGFLFMVCAIRVHSDGEYHPTWGDRNDGRRLRTLPPMAQITSYFQVERNTCSNFFEEAIEITNVERYIRQKRKEGLSDFGITHVLLAAYVRCLAKYPQLNRFVSGQKVYSRGEDIQYCMVLKKEMNLNSPDTSIKVHLNPRDTSDDVYNKLNAAVDRIKRTRKLDTKFDHLVNYFNLIPSVVLKFLIWFLKLLDYFGLLPLFLTELSPFHGTVFFTSMGSLGINAIYHHLYNFGNLPVFMSFGCKRKVMELQEDGSIVTKKYVDLRFVTDERITDGYGYATFTKHYRNILRHPEIMDNPPEEVVRDID